MANITPLQAPETLKETRERINRQFNELNQDIIQHKESSQAHDAETITYNGEITGAENTKQAIDYLETRISEIVTGGSEGKDPELTDIKTPDPSYTPKRTITAAGDIIRDMQQQFSEQLAETMMKDSIFINIVDHGCCQGDDDTETIQSLIDSLENGGTIIIPNGKVALVRGLLITNPHVTIQGYGFGSRIKQLSGVFDTPIIKSTSSMFTIKDIEVEGDWETVSDSNNGLELLSTFNVSNVRLQHINGDGIKANTTNGIINHVFVYKTAKRGIYIGADTVVNSITIGRTGGEALYLGGGHNTINNVFSWMAGANDREELNYTSGYGARITAQGSTVVGLTVIASVLDGIYLDGCRDVSVLGFNSRMNGRYDQYNTSKAGILMRNVSTSTVIGSSANNPDYDGNMTWGKQKYGVRLENIGACYGNIIYVSTRHVDVPLYTGSANFNNIRANEKNNVVITDESGIFDRLVNSLPTASESKRGMIITVAGGVGVADKQYVCIKTDTDTYAWKEVTFVT